MTTQKIDEPESAMEHLLKQLIPWIAGLMVVALGFYVVWFSSAKISHDSGDWGTLGDYFGGLMNPVISFATLLVAYAVWRQQKVELRQTKVAMEEQAKTAEQQRREQRFFDLMSIYYRTVENTRFDYEILGHGAPIPTSSNGKDAIQKWLSTGEAFWAFTEEKGTYVKNNQPFAAESMLSHLKHTWGYGGPLFFGAYLRTMPLILSKANSLLKEDHKTYIELLKAQLSIGELVLIGYHLLFDQKGSAKELLVQAKRYGLLSDLIPGDLRCALEDLLPAEVFVQAPNEQT